MMDQAAPGIAVSSLGEIAAVIVPVVAGVAFVFQYTQSQVKAAMKNESDARHSAMRIAQQAISTLDNRTTQLERNCATREDLAAVEARMNSNFSEVKIELREQRAVSTSILEKVAGLRALITGAQSGNHAD